MDKIFDAYAAKKVRAIKGDFIDRLHSTYTVTLLSSICILVSLKQYDGGAIVCWLPAYFSDDQTDYAHQLCWVNNTYHYPSVTDADLFPETLKYVIPYYQFILFLLFGQTLLFYCPTFLWNAIVSDSAGYIKKVLDQIEKADLIKKSIERFKEEVKTAIAENETIKLSANNNQSSSDQPSTERPRFVDDNDQTQLETIHENKRYPDYLNYDNKSSEDSSDYPQSSEDSHEQQVEESKLLPKDLSDSIQKTVFFVKELKTKPAKKVVYNDDPKSELNQLDDEEFNEKDQEANLESNFEPDGVRYSSKNTSVKKRVISFMKPIRGVRHLAPQYMLLKLFNLFNVILQIILLHLVFGANFYKYGYDFFYNIYNNKEPFDLSKQFPIITFCDFYIHQNLGKIYWHSAQCILSINIFIEKFYVIIWFWLIILLIVTFFNIISWINEIYILDKTLFLRKYIGIKEGMLSQHFNDRNISTRNVKSKSILTANDLDDLHLFQKKYLGNDGFVMLHMIKAVIGDIIFIELLYVLWTDYKKNKKKLEKE